MGQEPNCVGTAIKPPGTHCHLKRKKIIGHQRSAQEAPYCTVFFLFAGGSGNPTSGSSVSGYLKCAQSIPFEFSASNLPWTLSAISLSLILDLCSHIMPSNYLKKPLK